jgi:aryl-alcohol dehydrogenase-like predicted oxidoreductase
MEHRKLGEQGLEVAAIGFGTGSTPIRSRSCRPSTRSSSARSRTQKGITVGQLALAWLLARIHEILPAGSYGDRYASGMMPEWD